ncbi:MAG TPA: archease [Candidatus Bathyarchaeia archaeon]|nr:archease [Candidatus Bathyarchaeia archaeon]
MSDVSRREGYGFLEHTTDALIEAWSPTLERAFGQAGRALFDTMLHIENVAPSLRHNVSVSGYDEKELLYNWLEELLLRFELRSMAYSVFIVTSIVQNAEMFELVADIQGERYDRDKHGSKTEVKGVTYHLMEITKSSDQVRLRFLLDL